MGQPADHGHHHRHDHHHDHDAASSGLVLGRVTRRLSRRLFVQEFGRRTMAVAILGTATVACASDAADVATSANDASTDATAPTEAAEATEADASTAESAEVEDTGDAASGGALQWEQVSLGFVSAYVLARGNEFAVVDTGLAGNSPQIGQALGLLGAKLDDLDHVILTHLHGDHVGSLPELLEISSAAAYAGEADVAGIDSPREITAVNDGDDVFGLRVIATPGHTAGHICLYDEDASLLIAGDAMVEANGEVEAPPEQFTEDMAAATTSAKALAALQFENLAVGHGSPIRGGASARVAAAFG